MKDTLSRLGLIGRTARLLGTLFIGVALCWPAGCTNLNMNPSYFPYLFPTPYANFDPDLVTLEVQPISEKVNTVLVRTQHVLLVTVKDKNNNFRRGRQVEFMVSGPGSIVDAAPTGLLWRNRADPQYAITETVCFEKRLTSANGNPIAIRPGQTWCVLTSPVEGDTHVTIFAPGIHDWEKRIVYTTIRWVNANWEFPAAAQVRAGTAHVLTTKLVRHTDKQPFANYRVRYKIEDGAGAVFVPSNTQEFTAISDLNGLAQVAILEKAPILGTTKVSIEVVRPPDPSSPGGSGVVLAHGETSVDWLAPAVALTHTGPSIALADSEVTYQTLVKNVGPVEAEFVDVVSTIPVGLQYLRLDPPGQAEGGTLTWPVRKLAPGQSYPIRATYKTSARLGSVEQCVEATTEGGIKDRKCVTTNITTAALKVSIAAPPTAVVGQPIIFNVSIANPGGGPLENILATANFSAGLEHESKSNTLNLPVTSLPAQQTRLEPLPLVARQPGPQTLKVTATAGALSDQFQVVVMVQQPQMSLSIDGKPNVKYVGQVAEWTLELTNPGDAVLNNVVVRDRLPAQLDFNSADQGGEFKNGEVFWSFTQLEPRGKRILKLTTLAKEAGQGLIHSATASAEPGIRAQAQTKLDLLKTPAATKFEVKDDGDPVAVGKKITYYIKLTNTGQEPLNKVELKAVVPPELKIVSVKGPPGSKEPATVGQTITFDRVDGVEKDRPLEYRVEAEALRAGSVRFRAELRTEGRDVIPQEQATTIFDPNMLAPVRP